METLVIPPTIHYDLILPNLKTAADCEEFLRIYYALQLQFLILTLKFKYGKNNLHHPNYYRTLQKQKEMIDIYIADLHEKKWSLLAPA